MLARRVNRGGSAIVCKVLHIIHRNLYAKMSGTSKPWLDAV